MQPEAAACRRILFIRLESQPQVDFKAEGRKLPNCLVEIRLWDSVVPEKSYFSPRG
jgi:hypothetical protein